jgi:hypothetical protein
MVRSIFDRPETLLTHHIRSKWRVPTLHFFLDFSTKMLYRKNMMKMLEHLRQRHVDTSLHTVWVDDAERVATFPLWTLNGTFAGYQTYRPEANKVQKNDEKGRYYTFRGEKLIPRHCKTVTVWGLESWYLTTTLFVTEGVFDAARLTELGVSAVAVLSNDPNTSTLNWLRIVRQTRPVVAVCDPGKAGRKLAKVGHVAHIVVVPGQPDADLGDAPESYVRALVAQYV